MSSPIVIWPLKLAGMLMLASLPVLWWAAYQADHSLHLETTAAVMVFSIAAWHFIDRYEATMKLEALRRLAVRNALLIAMIYLWGSGGILVSYYLTDLSWYHAYQYAIYLAVPGLISIDAMRRNAGASGHEQILRNLARGRLLAVLQAVMMVLGVVYLCLWTRKFLSTEKDWAAMSVLTSGAVALACISGIIGLRSHKPGAD